MLIEAYHSMCEQPQNAAALVERQHLAGYHESSAVRVGLASRCCLLVLPQTSPHVLVVWRPDLHTYTAHIMQKTNASVPTTCKMNNADLPKVVVQGLGKAVQLWQEDVHVSYALCAFTCGRVCRIRFLVAVIIRLICMGVHVLHV